MEHLGIIWGWMGEHRWELLVGASALVNALLALHRPERVVEALERHPRGRAVVDLLRSLGVDPVGALRALQALLAAKAAQAAVESGESKGGELW